MLSGCVHHGVYEAPLLSVLAMKVVLLLSLLVVAATAAPKDKRFLIKDITNWWHDVWNKAKNEFNHIVDGIHGSKCSLHQSAGELVKLSVKGTSLLKTSSVQQVKEIEVKS